MGSQNFDIVKSSPVSHSFRCERIAADFDFRRDVVEERFVGKIEMPEKWNVGLIVGASGTGKSTIARELFGQYVVSGFDWCSASVVDDMPQSASANDIERMFYAVGFGSVPSWFKPFHVLSNGEKMRVTLARALLGQDEIVAFDEFTSVVDRKVAETACLAIAKAVKNTDRKFVAISCHRDVAQWLAPDWAFDTDTMENFPQPAGQRDNSQSCDVRRANGNALGDIII